MPWTTPKTWATGELVTAADLNLHVRDNLLALKNPPFASAYIGVPVTTTSTTFVDITGAAATFTSTGGLITAMFFVPRMTVSPSVQVSIRMTLDGNPTNGLGYLIPVGNTYSGTYFHNWSGIAAGVHTVRAQWYVLPGYSATATIEGNLAYTILAAGEVW